MKNMVELFLLFCLMSPFVYGKERPPKYLDAALDIASVGPEYTGPPLPPFLPRMPPRTANLFLNCCLNIVEILN